MLILNQYLCPIQGNVLVNGKLFLIKDYLNKYVFPLHIVIIHRRHQLIK